MNPNCLFRHLNGTYADKLRQSALGRHVRQNRIAPESFARYLARSFRIAVRDVTGPAIGLIFLADPHLYGSGLEGNAALGERDHSVVYHTSRRTIASHLDWARHISLVEIDSLGLGARGYMWWHRRRPRCAHRVRPWPGLGCI